MCAVVSKFAPAYRVTIESEMRSVVRPTEVIQDRAGGSAGRWRLINRGRPGFEVATYRAFTGPNGNRHELLSEDTYPEMNRIVRIVTSAE